MVKQARVEALIHLLPLRHLLEHLHLPQVLQPHRVQVIVVNTHPRVQVLLHLCQVQVNLLCQVRVQGQVRLLHHPHHHMDLNRVAIVARNMAHQRHLLHHLPRLHQQPEAVAWVGRVGGVGVV